MKLSLETALRRALALASAVLMFASGARAEATSSNPWPRDFLTLDKITSLKIPIDPPVPQPEFDPADYAAYAKPGIGVVDGTISIATTRGTVHCGWSNPLLVPATAYTWWLFQRVATVARDTGNPMSGRLFLKSLPPWMQPTLDDRLISTGVVRRAYCANDGYFRFEKVPFGHYLLVVDLQLVYHYSVPEEDIWKMTTADGRDAFFTYQDRRGISELADGLFVGMRSQIPVKPERPQVGIPPEGIGVFAHMHSTENYAKLPTIPTLNP